MSAERNPILQKVFDRNHVPQELGDGYEHLTKGVSRWMEGVMTPSDYPESVLDHTGSSLELGAELQRRFPALRVAINWERVEDRTVVHDVGEIAKSVGDLVISREDYSKIVGRRKKRERKAFRILTGLYIKDVELRAEARQAYNSYALNYHDDPDAIMAKYIDKVDAARFGRKHVYSPKTSSDPLVQKHAMFSLGVILQYVPDLLRLLPQNAGEELMAFTREEIEDYRKVGYPQAADEGQRRLEAIWEELTNLEGGNLQTT